MGSRRTIAWLAPALALLLLPEAALAWGPATHLELAGRILGNLTALPPAVAALLNAHPLDFYYGSIAADIVVAKKLAHYLSHCHRWTVGLEVQEAAETPSQQSFAWGYLAHLAADVVAHNYFVPFKVILSFAHPGRNHAFWEVRFDTHCTDEVWEVPRNISRRMHLDNDELLKNVLSRQLLSFQTNKVFFNNVLLMGRFRKWQAITRNALAQARPALNPERVGHYKELSESAITAILTHREDAWCFRADPVGHQSLKAASAIAGELRRTMRKGRLSGDKFNEILEEYRPHLESTIFTSPESADLIEEAMEIIEADRP